VCQTHLLFTLILVYVTTLSIRYITWKKLIISELPIVNKWQGAMTKTKASSCTWETNVSFGQNSQAKFQDMNLVSTKYESENRTLRPRCSVPNNVRDQEGTT